MAKFVVFLTPTSNPDKPEVRISPKDDLSGMSSVDRYENLHQLRDALVLLGKLTQEIEHELGKLTSQEEVTLLFDITEEQAKAFGWAGNP